MLDKTYGTEESFSFLGFIYTSYANKPHRFFITEEAKSLMGLLDMASEQPFQELSLSINRRSSAFHDMNDTSLFSLVSCH